VVNEMTKKSVPLHEWNTFLYYMHLS